MDTGKAIKLKVDVHKPHDTTDLDSRHHSLTAVLDQLRVVAYNILVTLSNVVHCKSYHHRHSFCSQMTYEIYLSNIMQKFPGFLGFYILIYILNCCFLLADCRVTVSCTQQRASPCGLAGRVLSVYRYWIVSLSV